MNDDDKKKLIEEEGHDASEEMGELDALEPATPSGENEDASETDLPENTDGIAEENEFSSGPEAEGDRG